MKKEKDGPLNHPFLFFDTRTGFEVFSFILTSIMRIMTNKRPINGFPM